MKIIRTRRDLGLEFVSDSNVCVKMTLPNNSMHVMSDGVVKKTISLYGENSIIIVDDCQRLPNRYNNDDLTNKKILIIREGGAGDLLFNTPVFRYFKEKYQGCYIGISCLPVYHCLFHYHPHINFLYAHVMRYEDFKGYDYFITFEGLIEDNPEAQYVNAYDLFIKQYNIPAEEIKNKVPVLAVAPMCQDYWKTVLQGYIDLKTIVYQLRASAPIRTLPMDKNAEIIRKLMSKGYTVLLLDAQSKHGYVARFMEVFQLYQAVDVSKYSDNFERMAGLISLARMYCGPDSSGTHVAGALGIPIVGIYGPFRSRLRLQYYKNAVGIDCRSDLEECGFGNGCYRHIAGLCDLGIQLRSPHAPCWNLLDTNTVVEQIEHLWNKVYQKGEIYAGA